jgi:hypothetical protein
MTLWLHTEKADVHRECLQRNRKHFNQAAGTPFTIYPLSEVGTKATKFKMGKMPDGRSVRMPSDTFLETNTIIDLLQSSKIPVEANISAEISLEDFVSAIQVWNENTSTSPSGRHLGHYKLLVNVFKDKLAKPALKEKAEVILRIIISTEPGQYKGLRPGLLEDSRKCHDIQETWGLLD